MVAFLTNDAPARVSRPVGRCVLISLPRCAAMETLGFLELSNRDIADDLSSGADDPRCVGFFAGNRLPRCVMKGQ